MIRFLAPALVMFPLLGGVPMEAASAATIGHAPLINQTEDRAIVKVAEMCGPGIFVTNTAIVAIMGMSPRWPPPTRGAQRIGILCRGLITAGDVRRGRRRVRSPLISRGKTLGGEALERVDRCRG